MLELLGACMSAVEELRHKASTSSGCQGMYTCHVPAMSRVYLRRKPISKVCAATMFKRPGSNQAGLPSCKEVVLRQATQVDPLSEQLLAKACVETMARSILSKMTLCVWVCRSSTWCKRAFACSSSHLR